MDKKGKVFFIGAGPGDPELLTLKGEKILNVCDVVIYAGSLVNEEILDFCKPDCIKFDSASMNLDEIISVIERYISEEKIVVRLHTGDPSLYGAIFEQMTELDKRGIEYEVIPGVSSAFAGSALLKKEFTVPGVTQTVIFTRYSGRTPVPEKEKLSELSKHRASMVIFLSVGMIDDVIKALKTGYKEDTPVAVVYRASWEDEWVIRGTLEDIAEKVKEAGIKRQALIYVGDFLAPKNYEYSKLYDESFEHNYRKIKE
ncbi:MAG: precorrin-4 C(11)-methyltransferase [Proteobacteria bacterium]|nr:precorrin-4 C(11)-methyltransferase [Pseudomonadota bacterium]